MGARGNPLRATPFAHLPAYSANGDRRRRRTSKTNYLINLSTVANSKSSNRPWVNIQSAGGVNIQSARTRGYADYMQTAEFGQKLASLMQEAKQEQVALMCAEAVPWRGHRSLIADALVVHGFRVEEVVNLARRQVHALTSFAKVNGTEITYPP